MSKIKKKLSSKAGESLLETLVALLIIVMAVSFLTSAIIGSGKISSTTREATENGFSYLNGENVGNVTVTADKADVMTIRTVSLFREEQFKDSGTYYYYYEP